VSDAKVFQVLGGGQWVEVCGAERFTSRATGELVFRDKADQDVALFAAGQWVCVVETPPALSRERE